MLSTAVGSPDNCRFFRYSGQLWVLSTTVGTPDNRRCSRQLSVLPTTGDPMMPCQKLQCKNQMNFPSPGGHSIVKSTGSWLDNLGSGILVEKIFWGSSKILIWTNVRG